MPHNIYGIITSFKYDGPEPSINLVGDLTMIPTSLDDLYQDVDISIKPFEEFSEKIKDFISKLSYQGTCAYIETCYHGGQGGQCSYIWENGQPILGPLTFHGSINEALRFMGIQRTDEYDEFTIARLGWYRSNEDFFDEIKKQS